MNGHDDYSSLLDHSELEKLHDGPFFEHVVQDCEVFLEVLRVAEETENFLGGRLRPRHAHYSVYALPGELEDVRAVTRRGVLPFFAREHSEELRHDVALDLVYAGHVSELRLHGRADVPLRRFSVSNGTF